jgi:hypothetical protein
MLTVHNKDRLRDLMHTHGSEGLPERVAFLATYGGGDVSVSLSPSMDEPYISVTWSKGDKPWMFGALLRHSDGTWSTHT